MRLCKLNKKKKNELAEWLVHRSWLHGFGAQLDRLYDACTSLLQKHSKRQLSGLK